MATPDLLAGEDWKEFASCRGQSRTPDSLWWAVGTHEIAVEAKRTCDGCIVQQECLEAAVAKPPSKQQGLDTQKS